MQYLLDTNICIFFLIGKPNLDSIVKERSTTNCFMSELTVFDLKFGTENNGNPKKSLKAVNKFIQGISIIPIYGIVYKYAIENKLTLVTNNTKY